MGFQTDKDARKSIFGADVAVGERVTLDDPLVEYVVVNVDHKIGRVELLRLKPGRIERDVPVSTLRKRGATGPRLIAQDEH